MEVPVPKEKWTGSIGEMELGASREKGGSRRSMRLGGNKGLPFLSFEDPAKRTVALAGFVADSLEVRRKANLLSLKDLAENLKEEGNSIFNIPLVMQYNKRDLEAQGIPLLPLDMLEKDLNSKLKVPYHMASALNGEGVGSTLKEALLLTLRHLQKEIHWTK